MDEVHAAMRDQMPAELVEQCDEMHAAMSGHMADIDFGSMMASMGSTMGGADTFGGHAAHHPGTEG